MSNNVFPDVIDTNPKGDYGLNIQRGLIPNVSVIHKSGNNPDVGNSAIEDVWDGGGEYTGFNATSAEIVSISSDNSSDSIAGTGARTVVLIGLGAGFISQTETIELNGTTPVQSVNTYIRLDRALVLTAGSDGQNNGIITGGQSITTANVFFKILVGNNRTLSSCYTVPFGKVGYVNSLWASLSKSQSAFVNITPIVRYPGSVFQIVESFTVDSGAASYVYRDFKIPLVGIPAGTDVKFAAESSANNIGVSAGFEMTMVDV